MSDKMKSLAMLDVAEILLKDSKKPMTIQQLIQSVAEIKEISLEDVDKLTQLYMDITQSAKFVYCGDDQWDLKERNLELWDKDGFAFVQAEEVEEDVEEDLDFTEYTLEEEEEEVKAKVEKDDDEDEDEEEVDEEIKEEKAYIEIDLPTKSTDDDDVDDDVEIEFDDDYDEDDYNEIMDDYEDMYDE
ncbi:MAG: DNA-directed RNA polymerase subunit delta [Tenericutes bacterium]|jgi:DNA-directed RNA polymerase subunit delta|nr:DNA-directed RNA polymerase subunit delta [Mycoplasmatota bacterium]